MCCCYLYFVVVWRVVCGKDVHFLWLVLVLYCSIGADWFAVFGFVLICVFPLDVRSDLCCVVVLGCV